MGILTVNNFEKFRIPEREVDVAVRLLTHNVIEYVDRAVKSVLAQENVKFALIVFDDYSTDGTYERLLEYERNFPDTVFVSRPKVNSFSQEKPEMSVVLLEHTKSKYLAFLDGDDYWSSNKKLEHSLAGFENPEVSATYHSIDVADCSNGSTSRAWKMWHYLMNRQSSENWMRRVFSLSIPTNSLVIRSEHFPHLHSKQIFRLKNPDLLLKYNATRLGKLIYIPDRMSVLQVRDDSLWGPLSPAKKFFESLRAGLTAARIWGITAFLEIVTFTILWSIFYVTAFFWPRPE